jgi:hypothetical protein
MNHIPHKTIRKTTAKKKNRGKKNRHQHNHEEGHPFQFETQTHSSVETEKQKTSPRVQKAQNISQAAPGKTTKTENHRNAHLVLPEEKIGCYSYYRTGGKLRGRSNVST